ncbi:MAG: PEGA domain-containing protein [Planctomycetota bacterium]|nr:MAG: PEGA domain-containing protein [Planctomycetota bacterium]
MKTFTASLITVLAIAGLLLVGCGSPRTWDPNNKPQETATPGGLVQRIVLFAPVDASVIHEDYPAANTELARSMARRADMLITNTEAWVGSTLPNSSDRRWNQGPVGAASGAHYVVLTRITGIERSRSIGPRPGRITATVLVRVINPDGEEIWTNEFRGFADDVNNPRIVSDAGRPVSKAAWDACDTALWGLRRMFDARGLPGRVRPDRTAPVLEEAALIDVTISSIPENADIFVDGIFRGNTPTVVPLPVKMMNIRIERAGFKPWEREVRPSPEMRIQPALQPLAGSAPAGNTLPRPSEPVPASVDNDPSAVTVPDRSQGSAPAAEEAPAPQPTVQPRPAPAPAANPVEELRGVDLPPVE